MPQLQREMIRAWTREKIEGVEKRDKQMVGPTAPDD